MDIQQCLNLWPVLTKLKPEFCNRICSFLVMKSGVVLAITRDDMVYRYTEEEGGFLDELVEIRAKGVISLHAGLGYQLALTRSGLVFTWFEKCDDNVQTKLLSRPRRIQFDLDDSSDSQSLISMVRGGDCHAAALTREGLVYCWGGNQYGQCGVGNKDTVSPSKPKKVIIREETKVTQIECGLNHTLVLTNRGEVFAWGRNECGQLGIGNDSDQTVPVRVTIAGCDTPIKQIACGQDYSLLMTTEGLVFGFGDNLHGQVGCKSSTKRVYQSLLIDCPNRFKAIAAYRDLSVALCQNGFCFVWGLVGESDVRMPRQTDCSSMLTAIGDLIKECPMLIQVSPKLQTTCPHPDSHQKSVSASVANSFNQQENSDLEFVVQGQSIYAHRSILRITSPYFRRMLSDTWSQTDIIEISDQSHSYPVYLAYLRFLYTDSIEIEPEFIPELLDLSVSYLESVLTQHCTELLSLSFSVANCCQFYLLLVQYELAEFERFVLEFIAANQCEVFQSAGLQSMSADQCKELVIKLGSFPLNHNNCPARKKPKLTNCST